MRLSQDSSRLPFFVLVALPVLVVIGFFLLQVLPDIVRPDSSCKSFLVSCQAVTYQSSPGRVRRPVGLKRPLSPKVSFQHLPSALASFSGFLVSLSTSRSALGGSSANVVPVTKNVDHVVCCPYRALLIYDFFILIVNRFQYITKIRK